MKIRRWSAAWSLLLTLAILTTFAWPVIARAAQDAATPVASPGAPDGDQGPVTPLTTASVVPADAVLYVAATLDSSSDQWAQSDALIRRAGLGDLLEEAAELVTVGGVDIVEPGQQLIFDGEAALVVADFATFVQPANPATTPSDADQPAGFAFVIAPRDPDAAEAFAREETEREALDRGSRVLEVEEGGATIVYAPGDEFVEGTALVRLGDLLVVSATPDDLAPFIATAAGQTPALDADPAFVRLRGELSSDFLAFGFTNGPALRAAVEAALAAAAADPAIGSTGDLGDLEEALASLDIYAAFVLWADDPGFRVDALAMAAEGATLPPVPANFDPTLDERVPADTLLFVDGFDLGPSLAPSLDAAAAALAQAAAEDPTFPFQLPVGADEVEQAAAVWELAGRFLAFNPRTDLVDQLVGEWGLALSVDLDDPALVSAVLVSGVADEVRLNDAVTKLAVWFNLVTLLVVAGSSSEGDPVFPVDQSFGAHTEEVNGALTQVIEIPIPELGTTIRLQWGIVNGQFVFGVGDGFGDYTAGPDAVLADNPRYQAIMAELPAEHFSVFYFDLGQLIELVMPLIEEEMNSGASSDGLATPEPIVLPDLSAIQALAAVAYERDGLIGTSVLLMIAEE